MNKIIISKLLLLLSLINLPAIAETLPKWELGLGMVGFNIHDYRGSKESNSRLLPVPYIHYRGEFFKSDRDGMRGLLFNSDNFEFNISANTSLIGKTEDNPLRQGMSELKSTFEIGPALDVNLTGENLKSGWLLRLPFRAVYAFDEDSLNSIDQKGWLFNPHFTWRRNIANDQWQLRFSSGLYYGNEALHDYYYGVAPAFALDNRPAFQAKAGYSGTSTQFSIIRFVDNMWFGAYLRYDNLNDTVFIDSPLIETENYFTVALGIGWILYQSK